MAAQCPPCTPLSPYPPLPPLCPPLCPPGPSAVLLMVALLCSRLWLLAVLYYGWWLWDWHGPERGDKGTPGVLGRCGEDPHTSPLLVRAVSPLPPPPPRSPSQPLGPELEDVGTLL